MSRSVLKPAHIAQLKDLRAWAREAGKTPDGRTNAERKAENDLAQDQRPSQPIPSSDSQPKEQPQTAALELPGSKVGDE